MVPVPQLRAGDLRLGANLSRFSRDFVLPECRISCLVVRFGVVGGGGDFGMSRDLGLD